MYTCYRLFDRALQIPAVFISARDTLLCSILNWGYGMFRGPWPIPDPTQDQTGNNYAKPPIRPTPLQRRHGKRLKLRKPGQSRPGVRHTSARQVPIAIVHSRIGDRSPTGPPNHREDSLLPAYLLAWFNFAALATSMALESIAYGGNQKNLSLLLCDTSAF